MPTASHMQKYAKKVKIPPQSFDFSIQGEEIFPTSSQVEASSPLGGSPLHATPKGEGSGICLITGSHRGAYGKSGDCSALRWRLQCAALAIAARCVWEGWGMAIGKQRNTRNRRSPLPAWEGSPHVPRVRVSISPLSPLWRPGGGFPQGREGLSPPFPQSLMLNATPFQPGTLA